MSIADQPGFKIPPIRTITAEAPWRWLAAGWEDVKAHPAISLGYGLAFVIACYLVVGLLAWLDLLVLALPVGAGVVFVGPLVAAGLYELSRRIALGEAVRLRNIVFVRTAEPAQIAFLGLVLMLFALAWVRIATLLFALFYGENNLPLGALFRSLFLTMDGLVFLAVGSAVGAALAFVAYAISAVSIPLLLERESDAVSAIATSIAAVRTNFWPMVLWAWLIGVLTAVGFVTLFLGFVVIFPLVGHATWHGFKALVGPAG